MMVRFDNKTTAMQVWEQLLECVDNGEKLPFIHRIILFRAGEVSGGKGDWMGPIFAFLLSCSNTAQMPMSLASHVIMYGVAIPKPLG
jgi:hypothetical protein